MLSELAKRAIQAPFHLLGLEVVRRRSTGVHDQKIYFLHLPKCGGVSINRAMSRAFGPQKLAGLDPKASWRAAQIKGKDPMEYRMSLLHYYLAMQNVNVVTGHFTWDDDVYDRFSSDWAYVTLLRDPIRRWFSHYFYDRYTKGGYFKVDDDLASFLHSERAREMGTLYTRRLSDSQVTDLDYAAEQAKANLEKFDVLGLTEDMNAFVDRFSRQLGVRLSIPRKNANPAGGEKAKAQENEDYVDAVRELCKHDMAIYDHARKLLAEGAPYK